MCYVTTEMIKEMDKQIAEVLPLLYGSSGQSLLKWYIDPQAKQQPPATVINKIRIKQAAEKDSQ